MPALRGTCAGKPKLHSAFEFRIMFRLVHFGQSPTYAKQKEEASPTYQHWPKIALNPENRNYTPLDRAELARGMAQSTVCSRASASRRTVHEETTNGRTPRMCYDVKQSTQNNAVLM